MITSKRAANAFILCLWCFVWPTSAQEGIYWMNSWQQSCYQDDYNQCRDDWYKTTQGSHLLIWEVFKTVERADSESLFASRDSLSGYGFLYPELEEYYAAGEQWDGSYEERVERDLNSYNLPLGVLKDKSDLDNRNYLGFSCAACHTGKVSYDDNEYYVEGGQANADVARFLDELTSALLATKADSYKLNRFRMRFALYVATHMDINARPVNALAPESYLDEAIVAVQGFTDRNHNIVANGPARLDAIGSILNQVLVYQAGRDQSDATALTAPVSYPYIWNVSDLECVQTNCIANNPLTRNIGQVLGVFGYSNLDEDENRNNIIELLLNRLGLNDLFEATPKVDNIYQLETALSHLNPPKWPSSFPPLNPELVASGAAVFNQNCSSCHINSNDGLSNDELTEPNSIGKQFVKVTKVAYDSVGTDPSFALDYGLRREPTGILGNIMAIASPDTIDSATGLSFGEQVPETFNALVVLGADTSVIVQNHYDSQGFADIAQQSFPQMSEQDAIEAMIAEYSAGHVDGAAINPTAYKAKPLDGIAFTGPFLHNGAVRTLADLLTPPGERASTFKVGTTEYDIAGGGYQNQGEFLLDTSIRGNSKDGHVYGTALSLQDKQALLEYLKSI